MIDNFFNFLLGLFAYSWAVTPFVVAWLLFVDMLNPSDGEILAMIILWLVSGALVNSIETSGNYDDRD